MEIVCYREDEISREPGSLPAEIYNLSRNLLKRSDHGVVFIPIRSMQYLAIMDAEEIVFVDGQTRGRIDIAWQHFRPQARCSLQDPVPYDTVLYEPDEHIVQSRLLSEFAQALQLHESRTKPVDSVKVLKFERNRSK